MQASLPTKTRLGQQTVCKETDDEKWNKKLSEYFYISEQRFLHIFSHSEDWQDRITSFIPVGFKLTTRTTVIYSSAVEINSLA